MKQKKFLVLGIIAAVIIGGGLVKNGLTNKNIDKTSLPVAMAKTADDKAAIKNTEGMAPGLMKGSYSAYSIAKLANADHSKVVLDFTASWCETCQAAAKNFRASTAPEGLTLLTVDYDKSTALKQKYGVTYQHTFVQVDKDGNLLKKWSGSMNYEEVMKQTV